MRAFEGSVGIFDSGVGGLTVFSELLRQGLRDPVLYVADQAHVPYGDRPLDEIRQFATAISRFLAEQRCRAIVMACNISSATAVDEVRAAYPGLVVLGVIRPGVAFAAREAAPRIGVLATQGTVASGAYEREILRTNSGAFVCQVACPRFVPLVESQETYGLEARDAARESLAPLAEAGCETVILGCTHYPYLLAVLQEEAASLFSRPVRFVDPARETASVLLSELAARPRSPGRYAGPHMLLTSGRPGVLAAQARDLLCGAEFRTGSVHWSNAPHLSLSLPPADTT